MGWFDIVTAVVDPVAHLVSQNIQNSGASNTDAQLFNNLFSGVSGSGAVLQGATATGDNGNLLNVPDYKQDKNECGPNSLRMVFEYYGMGGSFNIHDNYFSGTSVRDLENYAEDHGMKAGIVNNSNIQAIQHYLDQGMPVIVLGENPNGTDHYIVVRGYYVGHDGSINFNVNDGDRYMNEVWSQQTLENFWEDNYIPGSERMMLVMAPKHSDRANFVPETNMGDETTLINLMETIDDMNYSYADALYPFDTSGDFVGWSDWADNVWDGHANILGASSALPAQGLSYATHTIGGWIGGSLGENLQEWSNDASEFAYEAHNTIQEFHRDPVGTVKDWFGW